MKLRLALLRSPLLRNLERLTDDGLQKCSQRDHARDSLAGPEDRAPAGQVLGGFGLHFGQGGHALTSRASKTNSSPEARTMVYTFFLALLKNL